MRTKRKDMLKISKIGQEIDKIDTKFFTNQLVQARKRAKLKQREVGDIMGVTQTRVARIELNAANIKYFTIVKYLQACGCKLVIV